MFTASLNDAKNLKYIMESMSDLVDEAVFFLRKDMLRLEACDPSLVCKIELDLHDTFFNEYQASEERTIGLSMSALRKISRRIHLGDGMSLQLNGGTMDFTLHSSIKRQFQCMLLETQEDTLPTIDVEYPVYIEMDVSVFKEAIRDAAIVANSVLFDITPDEMIISAEGDTERARICIHRGSESVRKFEVNKECHSRFNLGYLVSFLHSSYISDLIQIRMGDKTLPLRVDFLIEGMRLTFYLAPMEL
ncbi:MAG: proliferating cell nuclear antigen (pcna) [Theionarchaea archaeon]|nr:proliferating cell nuclear antigen (pcna) [Theionarchaea archaeon]